MANIHNLERFNIKNLIKGEGVVLDVENDIISDNEDDFVFNKNVPMTAEEIANALSMDDDLGNEVDEREPFIIGQGNSFAELREKMEDISGNQKVYKYVMKKGTGEVVPENSRVSVKYIGFFEYQDEPFDSTAMHGTGCMNLRLNKGEMIIGLDIGIATMKKHETSVFLIHPDYAYGHMGCLPRIPPDSEVLFRVTLVDILDDSKLLTYESLSPEDQRSFKAIEGALKSLFVSASNHFKHQNYRQAIREYITAKNWLDKVALMNDKEELEMRKQKSRACSNLAICYLKEGKPRYAVRVAHEIYQEHQTAKTRFTLGKALAQMGQYDEAMVELQKALASQPNHQDIRDEISSVNEKKIKYNETSKKLWSNCLNFRKEPKERSAFQKTADDLCEMVLNDPDLVRHPLPDGLTPEEQKCIDLAAASRGLSIMTQTRYGKSSVYIAKRSA